MMITFLNPYYLYICISYTFRYGKEDILIALGILHSPGIIVKKVDMDYHGIHIIYSDLDVL